MVLEDVVLPRDCRHKRFKQKHGSPSAVDLVIMLMCAVEGYCPLFGKRTLNGGPVEQDWAELLEVFHNSVG